MMCITPGPYITFYGIIFLGQQWRVITLTPTLSCIASACKGGNCITLYAAFYGASVLLCCIANDAKHFITALPTFPHANCGFPYVSELPKYCTPNKKFQFQILRHYSKIEDYCYLYITKTSDKEQIIMKFTCWYSIDLHAFCAKWGHASRILGFRSIPGGWYVTAMEYILASVLPS